MNEPIRRYKAETVWPSINSNLEEKINKALDRLQDSVAGFKLISISSVPMVETNDDSVDNEIKISEVHDHCVVIAYQYIVE